MTEHEYPGPTAGEREAQFPIGAHNLAVITYRVLGSRDLDEAYKDDPVVNFLVNVGTLAISGTLRPTPSDRDGRARARAMFWEMVEGMQEPMRHRSLREWNAAIEHMVREREKLMAARQFPVVSFSDQIIDDRYAGLFKENGTLVKPKSAVTITPPDLGVLIMAPAEIIDRITYKAGDPATSVPPMILIKGEAS